MNIDLKEISELATKYQLLLIYLFGSKATKRDDKLSDIDIGVLIKKEREHTIKNLLFDLIFDFSRCLHSDKVDILILNNAPLALQYNVIAEGQILYEVSSDVKINYETEIIKLYLDFKKYEIEYSNYLHKRILEGVPE